MSFEPSVYQQNIFQFVQAGKGHGVVDAVPGSGKTTTLFEAAALLPPGTRALFVAFNTHVAKTLQRKLKAINAPMQCSTIHSLGNRLLGQTRVEEWKYRSLCREYVRPKNMMSATDSLAKLVDFVRLTLTDPTNEEAIRALVNHYDIEVSVKDPDWSVLWRGVAPILKSGIALARTGTIDFTDMIYLPHVREVTFPHYDYIFIDECQDLNAAQLALVMKCCPHGRLLFVGDKRQSLYGFAGADTQSVDRIIQQTSATVLPLAICYRCPPNIVALAAQIFPGIEVAPHKPDGIVQIIGEDDLMQLARPGDLILCRTTAPLVQQCLTFLRAGKKAMVQGKDLGKTFTSLLETVQKRTRTPSFHLLENTAELYRHEQVRTLAARPDNEMRIAALHDRVDTFLALREAYIQKARENATIEGFERYLTHFFTQDAQGPQPVVFSTIHRAKGSEVDRVFLIRPDLIPHPDALKPWQRDQELNIEYVALTRAKKALYFVDECVSNLSLSTPIKETMEVQR